MHANNLYVNQQIRALENLAIKHENLSEFALMQRAGSAAFDLLINLWPCAKNIVVICGGGNNGGDGYQLAYLAKKAKLNVAVIACKDPEKLQGAAKEAWLGCKQSKVAINTDLTTDNLAQADVIVDALLGTGVHGEITAEYQSIIRHINDLHHPAVFSLDVPSGLDVDTGNVLGESIKATHTITFIGLKRGLFTGFARDYAGDVHLSTLDLPEKLFESVDSVAKLIDDDYIKQHLKLRVRSSNKKLFGHVLVIGGDYGMAGATRLCAEAALRVGAGLVTVATRGSHLAQVNCMRPEIMCYGVERAMQLEVLIKRATVIAVGPGLGQSAWSKALLKRVLTTNLPKVIDADALNLLPASKKRIHKGILTPHTGEAARLLEITTKQIDTNRFVACQKIADKYKSVVVLKGAGSLVGYDKKIAVCKAGNPGMASAGMGDALTGIIAGLLAQGFSLDEAAQLGVAVHAQAGDLAAEEGERGMLALDLINKIRCVVNPNGS